MVQPKQGLDQLLLIDIVKFSVLSLVIRYPVLIDFVQTSSFEPVESNFIGKHIFATQDLSNQHKADNFI